MISVAEIDGQLSVELKLTVAYSVISHPGLSPIVRARVERIIEDNRSALTAAHIETAEKKGKGKRAEKWAEEILLGFN